MNRVRDEVAVWLEHGAGLSEVDGELSEAASAVREDERVVLRRFAWSYRPRASREAARLTRPVAE